MYILLYMLYVRTIVVAVCCCQVQQCLCLLWLKPTLSRTDESHAVASYHAIRSLHGCCVGGTCPCQACNEKVEQTSHSNHQLPWAVVHTRQLWWILHSILEHPQVSNILNRDNLYSNCFIISLHCSCIVGRVKLGKGNFGFSYLIPHHLSNAEGVLDLGGVLALGDEVSTVLLCCEDKTHRAGVSVTLTGEILRPEELKAGATVWMESVISKVGAALGFAEVMQNG